MCTDLNSGSLRSRLSRGLVVASLCSAVIQLFWFGSKCINQIDFDGMAYTGIARHVREGAFYLSINAFRSPLVSWLIAVLSIANRDYLHLGKLVSVCSWLLCLALLYVFTLRLAHSREAAGVAALLFTLGRGLCVIAVAFVTPDFLFSALVLIYFLLLLQWSGVGRR
jgi:hypothetical protein